MRINYFVPFYKRKALILVVSCFLYLTAYSQVSGSVKGKLSDKSAPIEFADVSLYAAKDTTKALFYSSTDSTGMFYLDKIPFGAYRLTAHLLGYKTISKTVTLAKGNASVDLGNIAMEPDAMMLKSVEVVASVQSVENKLDRIIYNAEKDITSQTGVATDVLKKVPMVSVDVDGNVELAGDANVRFLIDGKPSTIFGSNITDVLQSIPANQIKSIEVITNPGAKYDAQGTSGIINIILKHNTLQGINGNVSFTAGTIMQNGSFNFHAQKEKFGVNAFVNGNVRLNTTTKTDSKRTSTDTVAQTGYLLQQAGSGRFTRHGYQAGVGFNWSLDTINSITGAFNYFRFGNNSTGRINQSEQVQDFGGNILSDINSINKTTSAFTDYGFDPSLNYQRKFENKDQQLEIAMDGSFAHNARTADNNQYQQPLDSLIYGVQNSNPARENEYEATVDYVQPLHKDVNLGIGGKFSGYDISSAANVLIWNPSATDYLYNSFLSNNLDYHQKVYAAYAELNFPIGKSVSARIGGRDELTLINAFYADAQQTVHKSYNIFVPSIFLMKKIGEAQTAKLSYTKRINRPDYRDLDPFINTSDPTDISMGNPDLKPEIWDRYEASYTKDLGRIGSLMATLFYRQSNGDIQSYTTYHPSIQIGDTTYTNATVSVRKNIGVEKNTGIDLFFDFHVNEKLNLRSNFTFFYRYTINQVDTGYNSHGTIYRFNMNASYQLPKNFAAEFFGAFNSRHHEAQGNYPSFTYYSIAIRKLFWNKNGSIALTANNFFSKYVNQRSDIYGPGFVTSNLRQIPFRSIGINFTWKFGELEMKKETSADNSNDMGI